MAQLNLAPTKTNLIKLRNDLEFARQGYELLDQKRNILIIELMSLIDQAADHQSRLENALLESLEKIATLQPRMIYLSHGTHTDHHALRKVIETHR